MASALLIVRPSLQHLSKNAYPKSLGLIVKSPMANQTRTFKLKQAKDGRSAFRKAKLSKTPERFMALKQGMANNKELIFGTSILGLGALCYYEMKERSKIWPQYVKDRVKSTYCYFVESIVINTMSYSFFTLLAPRLSNLVARHPLLATAAIFVATAESLNVALSLPYSDSFGAKHLAFYTHFGIMGVLCAITVKMTSIPLAMRAVFYAAGVVGGLSTFEAHAPEKLWKESEPLGVACGLGVLLASSIGYKFFPPGAALYEGLLYVWTVVLGGLLLHNTHEVAKTADTEKLYDPINEAICLYYRYIDICLFIRLLKILVEQRRKTLSVPVDFSSK